MELFAMSLAALVGLSLGLLGGGGSILTVPILVYLLGFSAKQGIALGLVVVGVTAGAAAVAHWRDGNVKVPVALQFGLVAMCGSLLGARLATLLSGAVQLFVFGVVMLAAAVMMFRHGRRGGPSSPPAPEASATPPPRPHLLLVGLSALGVGLLTGIAGVGGGFLIVPALVLGVGLPMRAAVGTSLLVIALNSLVGFLGYLDQTEVPWTFLLGFTAVAVAGSLLGRRLSRAVSQATLKQLFAAGLVLMGTFILFENRHAFDATPPAASAPAALGGSARSP